MFTRRRFTLLPTDLSHCTSLNSGAKIAACLSCVFTSCRGQSLLFMENDYCYRLNHPKTFLFTSNRGKKKRNARMLGSFFFFSSPLAWAEMGGDHKWVPLCADSHPCILLFDYSNAHCPMKTFMLRLSNWSTRYKTISSVFFPLLFSMSQLTFTLFRSFCSEA